MWQKQEEFEIYTDETASTRIDRFAYKEVYINPRWNNPMNDITSGSSKETPYNYIEGANFVISAATQGDLESSYGGLLFDSARDAYVVYSTKLYDRFPRIYANSDYPIYIQQCDYSLQELGEAYRECNMVLDKYSNICTKSIQVVKLDTRQNRIAVFVKKWNSLFDWWLSSHISRIGCFYISEKEVSEIDSVQFALFSPSNRTNTTTISDNYYEAYEELYKVAETIWNSTWLYEEGTWQHEITSQPNIPLGKGRGKYIRLVVNALPHEPVLEMIDRKSVDYYIEVQVSRYDAFYGSPIFDQWSDDQEAFFRELLRGHKVTVRVGEMLFNRVYYYPFVFTE